jgi:SAM-dependent methyltransferase
MSHDWWDVFHRPEMADLFLVRQDQELNATIDFLKTELKLVPGARVYDQCCGIGSLSIALARQGILATGADLCDFYIERARQDAADVGIDCTFACADAFHFLPTQPCDAVFNWYSSFGYAHDDARNSLMLQRAFESLRPGGRLALDVPNAPGILRDFQRCLARHGISAGRRVTVVRESTVNLILGTLDQTWTWLTEGQEPITRQSAIRLYLPHQIREMLEQCGFRQIQFWGGIDRSPLTLDAPRLVITAERPDA